MTDPEIREILCATLEHLKTQMVYVRNLHEALAVLTDALVKKVPQLEQAHKSEMEKIRENVWQQSQTADIDALLQRLKDVPEIENQ
jgi:hypothetical protein